MAYQLLIQRERGEKWEFAAHGAKYDGAEACQLESIIRNNGGRTMRLELEGEAPGFHAALGRLLAYDESRQRTGREPAPGLELQASDAIAALCRFNGRNCSHEWLADTPCALVDTCALCGEQRA